MIVLITMIVGAVCLFFMMAKDYPLPVMWLVSMAIFCAGLGANWLLML